MKKFISLLLVCLMVVPFGMLATTGVSADTAKTVYLSDAGDDANDGSTTAKAVKTYAKAYEILGTNGGTIAIVGEATYAGYVNFPEHTGKITIKGVDKATSVMKIGAGENRYIMSGPTEFADLKIDTAVGSIVIVYQFYDLTITDTVTLEGAKVGMVVAAQSGNATKPSYNYTPKDCTITINGGTWNELALCSRSAGFGYVDDEGNVQSKTADDFKDYDVVCNIGGNATINKFFFFTRSYNSADLVAANSSATININGGVITHFAGLNDQKARIVGYENGVTLNIGKDFDISKSFNQVTAENRVSGDLFYGFDGEFLYEQNVLTVSGEPLKNVTLVVADEIYSTFTTSDKVAIDTFKTVKKASEVAPSQPEQPENPGQTPDTGDMTWVVAVVAAVAVMGSAIVLKKREN